MVAKAGGRVVKNVAGYDLGKLMIGSAGTLGVVVDAIFRLHPLPKAHQWVTVPVDDPAEAQRHVQSVLHAQAVPAAIEVDWAEGQGSVSVLLEGRDEGCRGTHHHGPASCWAARRPSRRTHLRAVRRTPGTWVRQAISAPPRSS